MASTTESKRTLKGFVSHAHKDTKLKEQIFVRLSPYNSKELEHYYHRHYWINYHVDPHH
jgi:hypothetical protein